MEKLLIFLIFILSMCDFVSCRRLFPYVLNLIVIEVDADVILVVFDDDGYAVVKVCSVGYLPQLYLDVAFDRYD